MPRLLYGVTIALTAQAFLRDQMAELATRGWEVHLACSKDPSGSFDKLRNLPGVTVHELPMTRPPDPVRDLVSLRRWIRLIAELRPDAVVASTPKAGLLGMLAARARRVPTRIYHVRGLRSEGLSGALGKMSRGSEKLAIAAATDVLVDSPSLLRALRASDLLPAGKGVVLGAGSSCGVDNRWFRPPTQEERTTSRDATGATSDSVVVGFVGRIAVDKGVGELVTACERAQRIDPRLRLVLVGPVEEGDHLRSSLSTVASSPWATAPGPTDDPRAAYWALDMFCLPSYREGFPISPLEAQACGVPVITTDATGCIDSIESGVTGLVVPVRDVDSLSDALLSLAADPQKRLDMAIAARARTVAEFDQQQVCHSVIEFIQGRVAASREMKGRTE